MNYAPLRWVDSGLDCLVGEGWRKLCANLGGARIKWLSPYRLLEAIID